MSEILNDKYTICDGCPCLNCDNEYGSDCNLGYDTNSVWVRISDDVIVKDTPEMRSHQDDFDLKDISKNCGLIKVITKDKEILPKEIKL